MLKVHRSNDKNIDTIMEINFGICPTTTSLLREFMRTKLLWVPSRVSNTHQAVAPKYSYKHDNL